MDDFRPTLQDLFSAAWCHFVVAKDPFAFDKDYNKCGYQLEDGRRCIIGVSLPDELIALIGPTHNNECIVHVCDAFDEVEEYLSLCPRDAVTRLQNIHDYNFNLADPYGQVESDLRRYASDYHLAIPNEEPSHEA